MKIHEYQAKALLSEYGIPVPRGRIAFTPAEAKNIARDIGGKVVIKAQIYAGARGKAGGIKVAADQNAAEQIAGGMLGTRLVTDQTSTEGAPVHSLLVEKSVEAKREMYLSIVIDRGSRMPVMMLSESGGMDIEEVARTWPDKIRRAYIDVATGFQAYRGRKLAYGTAMEHSQVAQAASLMANLYRLFMDKDCTMAEINPLVETTGGDLLALDAKLEFDDNALFRQPEIEQLRDLGQEDPLEVKARELGINNYIKMDGNIGCLVNGAGLAMAIMDLIHQSGGSPANFLDIGTVNDPNRVVNAFKIFVSDSNIRAILVNIFGGMARVDVVARGIIEAHRQMNIHSPLIIRLAGTNVAESKRILAEAKLKFIEAHDLYDAVCKAVAAAGGKEN